MELLRRNLRPLLMAAVAVLVLGGLTALILAQRTDAGFLIRQCSINEGKDELQWQPADYPLPVYAEAKHLDSFTRSASWWNDKVGTAVFVEPALLDPLMDYADPVVLVVDGDIDQQHGVARLKWTYACHLRHVDVRMPDRPLMDPDRVARHELGHALGLEHDPFEGWVMHPKYSFGGDHISDADLDRVRGTMR